MSAAMAKFVTAAVIAALGATAQADDRDDLLKALEARADSIASFDLTTRRASVDLEPNDYNDFRESVRRASQGQTDDQSPSEWAQRLVQAWVANPNWISQHMTQRGNRFKEVTTSGEGKSLDTDVYDGLLYYSYRKIGNQLDIYLKVPQIGHTSLAYLGVGIKGPSPERIVSFEKTPEGSRGVFTVGQTDPEFLTYDFGPGLELRRAHMGNTRSGAVSPLESETWYLFHGSVDGCLVPRVTVDLSIHRPREICDAMVRIVEQVRVNCPLAEDSLSLTEAPPDALVIDYRFGLPNQWRYSDYLQAPMNANAQADGGTKAEHFIEFLNRTRSERDAASTRDGRLGRMAPPLQISEWLHKPPAVEQWPTGRPMILEFWNITCGPCIASIPEHNELAAWIESKEGSFISIHSATHEPAAIREFLENHELHYAVGLDTAGASLPHWRSATFAAYGIDGIPTCVTIGRSGRILSYERLSAEKLERLLEEEPDEPPRGRLNVDIRPLTLLPKAWLASDLAPGSQVQRRLFLFRPETPDLKLRRWKQIDSAVQPTWVRQSADGQTVYEIVLKAEVPDPGEVLKGQIGLIAEYEQQERLLDIPYELASRR